MVKRAILGCFLAILGFKTLAHAIDTVNPQEGVIGPFGGLNNQDNSAVIGSNQAQDLLNVNITPGGKSVKKREGFGLDTAFSVSTSPVHGTYKFFDANGNEVRLVGQDNSLWASVGGASFVAVATGTLNATWQCTDWLGQAYCVTSARDTPVRTNGTTAGTSYQSAIPAGNCIASTADRLLVGSTAANPSRIYYSGSTNFVDFTLGTLNTSSSYEDITAPGSQITHLAYHFGYWMWWKDQSFGFMSGTGQADLNNVTVSDTIGTYDNTDVYWQSIDYFRGNDGQIYAYDGATVSPMTREITPLVNSSNKRKSSSWTQGSQADFASGAVVPIIQLSTSSSPGDVTVSSFSRVENSSTQWTNGTTSNTIVGVSSITLAVNNLGTVNDPSFEGPSDSTYWDLSSVTITNSLSASGCTITPQSGSNFATQNFPGVNQTHFRISLGATALGNIFYSQDFACPASCSGWSQATLTNPSYAGTRYWLQLSGFKSPSTYNGMLSKQSYIFSGSISVYYRCDALDGVHNAISMDNISGGSSTITAGSFTSQVYDTGFSSATYQLQSSLSANTSTPTFALFTSSAATGPWTTIATSTATNRVGARYVKYSSTITVAGTDSALPAISSVTIVASSSGTYYSAVHNSPNLTSWSTFGVNSTIGDASSITYYTRASTGSFSVLSSSPLWVAQTGNATVSASTGTYFQLRADFNITSATDTPKLNDFTFNWFEGTASDKMYGTYFDYGLWFSVSSGTASTNNIVLRYDLLNQLWTLYNIQSNGFIVYNNSLYFGSPTVGKLYKFGQGLTSDDNQAINAYWKSKDFFGASPFNDNDMRTLSWYTKASSGTTLTISYTTNVSSTTSYSLNLYSPTGNIIRDNHNFPAGSAARTINFQFGDNSTNPLWEVFAGDYTYVPRPWNAGHP